MQMPAHACVFRRVKSRVCEGRVGLFPPFNGSSWTSWTSWHHCFFLSASTIHRCLLKRRHPSNDQQGSSLQVLSECVYSFGSRTSQHWRTAGCSFYQNSCPALHGGHPEPSNLSECCFAVGSLKLQYLLGKKHEIRCVRRIIDSKDI